MYIVTIQNGTDTPVEIQNEHHKLLSGSVVQSINTIDSFTFSVLPNNPAFGRLHEFTTLVNVYNTAKRRYEFFGRVLCAFPQMEESGLITQDVTCESYLGFLCDSRQGYVAEKNWTVRGLLGHILDTHNAQMESYKHFHIGQVDVTDPNDNLYVGIQRENTFDTLKSKLIDKLGGEIRFRVVDGKIYLDYLKKIGETKETEIALSKNMKAITQEKDPSAFITRLIPLGAKKGDDTEERVDISSVHGGQNYLEDRTAVAKYGLHVGYVEFDDVTDPTTLSSKGWAWLMDNNKVKVKYLITALDLSLIGLDVDDFEVHNTHPVKNKLLGIDDTARINRKTIDVCEETKTSFEIGESFKTLRELQREQSASVGKVSTAIADIIRNYATNKALASEISKTVSLIEQAEERIMLSVQGSHEGLATTAQLELKLNKKDLASEINASADSINLKSDKLTISSTYFTLANGKITATGGKIGDWTIDGGNLVGNHGSSTGYVVKLTPSTLEAIKDQNVETKIDITWHELIAGVVNYRAQQTEITQAATGYNAYKTGIEKAANSFKSITPVASFTAVMWNVDDGYDYQLTFTNGILSAIKKLQS